MLSRVVLAAACAVWCAATARGLAGAPDCARPSGPQVAYIDYGDSGRHGQWACAGVIVGDRHVLTSAQCALAARYIVVGLPDPSVCDDCGQRHRVTVIAHPEYHAQTWQNDIALLRTKTSIKFGPHVVPACLPSVDVPVPAQAQEGILRSKVNSFTKLCEENFTNKDDKPDCKESLSNSGITIDIFNVTTQACYDTQDSINLDVLKALRIGGVPLLVEGSRTGCQATVLAVRSFLTRGIKNVYTLAAPYLPWIDSVVTG